MIRLYARDQFNSFVFKHALWSKIWSIFEEVWCAPEKNVFSVIVGWNALYLSVKSICSMVWLTLVFLCCFFLWSTWLITRMRCWSPVSCCDCVGVSLYFSVQYFLFCKVVFINIQCIGICNYYVFLLNRSFYIYIVVIFVSSDYFWFDLCWVWK